MDTRFLFFGAILTAAGILVWLGRSLGVNKIIKGRSPASIEEIHRATIPTISLETFTQVCNALGDAYGIAPTLIRPDDSLESFFKLDSWSLTMGTEKMNEWLAAQGIQGPNEHVKTVRDLLHVVEDARFRSPHS